MVKPVINTLIQISHSVDRPGRLHLRFHFPVTRHQRFQGRMLGSLGDPGSQQEVIE